jgi:hypothetical protein
MPVLGGPISMSSHTNGILGVEVLRLRQTGVVRLSVLMLESTRQVIVPFVASFGQVIPCRYSWPLGLCRQHTLLCYFELCVE